jgi:hypothetical protein
MAKKNSGKVPPAAASTGVKVSSVPPAPVVRRQTGDVTTVVVNPAQLTPVPVPVPESTTVVNPVPEDKPMTESNPVPEPNGAPESNGATQPPIVLVLQKIGKDKAIYRIPGIHFASVRFSQSVFANLANAPKTITAADLISGEHFAARDAAKVAKASKASMTPEERKAHLKAAREAYQAMTPAQKIAAKREKLEKEMAALRKQEAKIAPATTASA